MLGVARRPARRLRRAAGKGLIPAGDAGPLQSDFETVAQAAENGDGNCTATEDARSPRPNRTTATCPAASTRACADTLRQGIDNLRNRALALCAQPLGHDRPPAALRRAPRRRPPRRAQPRARRPPRTPRPPRPPSPNPPPARPRPPRRRAERRLRELGEAPSNGQGGGTGAGEAGETPAGGQEAGR